MPESTPSHRASRRSLGLALSCLAVIHALLGTKVAVAATPTEASGRGTLVLRNGDTLRGDLRSYSPDGTIEWVHPDSDQPLEFPARKVSEIRLAPRSKPVEPRPQPCTVRLVGGDEWAGGMVSMDETGVVLDTWYAGALKIPRALVDFIQPEGDGKPALFDGFTGLDGWTLGKVTAGTDTGQWHYQDGAIFATKAASIARILQLPELSSLEFDLAWKGYFSIAIALYTDSLQPVNLANKETEPDFGGFYSLQLGNYLVNLRAITQKAPIRELGQGSLQRFGQRNSAHVQILVNKPKGTIQLFLDDVQVKEWSDPEGFIGTGTGIRLVHQGQAAVRVSNFVARRWDGSYKDRPSMVSDRKQDTAKLRNGDKLAGRLKAIRDGKLLFELESAPLEVPWSRVRLIEFPAAPHAASKVPRETVAQFTKGGAATLHLLKWDPEGIQAESPELGPLKLDPSAFSRFQFKSPARVESGGPRARVRALRGAVEIQVGANEWQMLRVNQAFEPGSVIRTGRDSQLDLLLDGSEIAVRLLPDSVLTLEKLGVREEGAETITETELSLTKGRCVPSMVFLSPRSYLKIRTLQGVVQDREGGREITAETGAR